MLPKTFANLWASSFRQTRSIFKSNLWRQPPLESCGIHRIPRLRFQSQLFMAMSLDPWGRFFLVTDIAASPSILEEFVHEQVLRLDHISVPVKIGGTIENLPNSGPTTVPEDVVAVLIRQRRIPPTIAVKKLETGYLVTEAASAKREEFYLLFINCDKGRRCTIDGTVGVRYFYPRNAVARATLFAAYYPWGSKSWGVSWKVAPLDIWWRRRRRKNSKASLKQVSCEVLPTHVLSFSSMSQAPSPSWRSLND